MIVVTVILSYHYLGFLRGDQIAADGRSASLFFANFHFASIGTNYLSAQQPPSPLQNFWSLSVEEQFYVVYPSLFLIVAALARRWSLKRALTLALGAVVIGSFVWSVVSTSSNPTATYFSPLSRAWELAIGGLAAVGTTWFLRMPRHVAAIVTWVGLGSVLMAAFVFNGGTPYPGSAVALPVIGTALMIVGGAAQPRYGVEMLLKQRPFQLFGALSYSLYLWHWPILTIAAQQAGRTLSVGENLLWVLAALGVSAVSYYLIENPIRHAAILARRRYTTLGLGAAILGTTVLVVSLELAGHP